MTSELTDQQQKCLECYECCEYVEFPVTMLSMEIIEYFLFRGNKFYMENGGAIMMRVKDPCQHLNQDGTCKIYDDRPETCRRFMCAEKDKSIRKNKEQACESYTARVRELVEKEREKRKAQQAGEQG